MEPRAEPDADHLHGTVRGATPRCVHPERVGGSDAGVMKAVWMLTKRF